MLNFFWIILHILKNSVTLYCMLCTLQWVHCGTGLVWLNEHRSSWVARNQYGLRNILKMFRIDDASISGYRLMILPFRRATEHGRYGQSYVRRLSDQFFTFLPKLFFCKLTQYHLWYNICAWFFLFIFRHKDSCRTLESVSTKR